MFHFIPWLWEQRVVALEMSYQVLHVNSHLRGHYRTKSKPFYYREILQKFTIHLHQVWFSNPNGSHVSWSQSHFVLLKKPIHNTTPTSHDSGFWNWEIQALGRRKQRITPVEITSSENPSNQVTGLEGVGGNRGGFELPWTDPYGCFQK